MKSGKKVFAILGGIFLMAAGTFSFFPNVASFVTSLTRHGSPLRPFLLLCTAVLVLLGGLFLLLRKPKVAAIMMCAVTFVYVVYYAGYGGLFAPVVLCLILSCALFAAGLFGKGVYGLIMCLAAAFFRLIPYGNSVKNLPQLLSYGGLSSFGALCTQLSSLLTLAGMVMAGLYLLSLRKKA